MLRDKMLAVMQEVNSEIAEREELIQTIALALLSGRNLFILGAPGQAKSFAVNEFRKRITGAKQFERLLSKQTDEEALFGRLDLASLIPGAVPAQVLSDDAAYQKLKQQLEQATDVSVPILQMATVAAQLPSSLTSWNSTRRAVPAAQRHAHDHHSGQDPGRTHLLP